jgi:hypothetical protein
MIQAMTLGLIIIILLFLKEHAENVAETKYHQ